MSGIGNKRAAGEPGTSVPPEKKTAVEDSGTTVETIKLGGVSSTEELDIRTLQSKNRKLAEMLDQRQAIEDELREHIEKLERRQATDDASLLIVNRYWSQFDENIRIILKRYDLDQGLGDLLTERKALVVPEPEPDSDSNQERKDDRERAVPVKRWNLSFRSVWSPPAVLCLRLSPSMINCKRKWISYPGN